MRGAVTTLSHPSAARNWLTPYIRDSSRVPQFREFCTVPARRLFATVPPPAPPPQYGVPIRTGRVPTVFGRDLSLAEDAVAVEDAEHLERPTVDRRL